MASRLSSLEEDEVLAEGIPNGDGRVPRGEQGESSAFRSSRQVDAERESGWFPLLFWEYG